MMRALLERMVAIDLVMSLFDDDPQKGVEAKVSIEAAAQFDISAIAGVSEGAIGTVGDFSSLTNSLDGNLSDYTGLSSNQVSSFVPDDLTGYMKSQTPNPIKLGGTFLCSATKVAVDAIHPVAETISYATNRMERGFANTMDNIGLGGIIPTDAIRQQADDNSNLVYKNYVDLCNQLEDLAPYKSYYNGFQPIINTYIIANGVIGATLAIKNIPSILEGCISYGGQVEAAGVGSFAGGISVNIQAIKQALGLAAEATVDGTIVYSTVNGNNNEYSITERNKNGDMLGKNGAQFPSDTKWQNGKTERVDVENPNPGKRPGDVHYHDPKNKKYRFSTVDGKLYDEFGDLAPKKIQKVLQNKDIQKAIDRSLKVLGEDPYFK